MSRLTQDRNGCNRITNPKQKYKPQPIKTHWNKRTSATPAEMKLSQALKENNIPFEFQKSFIYYVPDFTIEQKKLIIEIDGGYHLSPSQTEKDLKKDRFFTDNGYKVLRFKNNQVFYELPSIILTIKNA